MVAPNKSEGYSLVRTYPEKLISDRHRFRHKRHTSAEGAARRLPPSSYHDPPRSNSDYLFHCMTLTDRLQHPIFTPEHKILIFLYFEIRRARQGQMRSR
jgi:hypothetical protein